MRDWTTDRAPSHLPQVLASRLQSRPFSSPSLTIQALSQLAFGSFAMHASGGHRLTTLLDVTPLKCLTTQILNGAMAKAGQTNLPVVVKGTSYAVDALASSCATSFSSFLEACNLDTMMTSLSALDTSLPDFTATIGRFMWSVHRACLDDPAIDLALLPLEFLARAFGLSSTDIADELDPFADALGFVAPGVAACKQYQLALGSFLEAALSQGTLLLGTVEMHHRWHEKSAEALMLMAEVLTLLPDPALRQPTCSSDDECQSGRSCLCNILDWHSKDVSRRRRALLFATAPHSCRCQ